jgi:hypothetical protein
LSLQVLVEYGDWVALARVGREHPGSRGEHLELVLRELLREADRNPGGEAPGLIRDVLDAISRDPELSEVLTPLAVLSTLQTSATLTLDVAKGFIQEYLRRQQGKAAFNAERIAALHAETEALKETVETKKTKPLVRSCTFLLEALFKCPFHLAVQLHGGEVTAVPRYLASRYPVLSSDSLAHATAPQPTRIILYSTCAFVRLELLAASCACYVLKKRIPP